MSTIETVRAKIILYEVLYEHLDVFELDALQSLGSDDIFEEIERASHKKQEICRMESMEALDVQICS